VLDQLVDVAERLPYESLRTVVKRWETIADADRAHRDAAITNERRTVSLNEIDGGLDLRASGGSALNTAMMKKIFGPARMADSSTRVGGLTDQRRSLCQRSTMSSGSKSGR
jgi:hypothetical protein